MSSSPTNSAGATARAAAGAAASIAAWIERASSLQVPVFSATVADVTSIADSSSSSAADLATAIGRDAGLTARVLKLANSPLFCQQGRKAQTIGSAVVLLGFNAVRDLAITLSIVRQAEQSGSQPALVDTLLQAFHRAGQARCIAVERGQEAPEEVFLAGLLSSLGELVFWASAVPETQTLAQRWNANACNDGLEKEVLGFTFRQLTAELVVQWNLGELLQSVVTHHSDDDRVLDVQVATDIAAVGPAQDWLSVTIDSLPSDPQRNAAVERRAALLDHKKSASLEKVVAQAEEVGLIARRFGVTVRSKPKAAPAPQTPAPALATDPIRQVALLGEMAQAMQGPVTLDQLLQLALTGIVEGAGFNRVFFAILTPDRAQLLVKHRRGEFVGLPKAFLFTANPRMDQVLAAKKTSVLEAPWSLIGESTWRAPEHSLLQPVMAGSTCIGLLYADMDQRKGPIPVESVTALVLFVQQVAMGLAAPGGS